MRSFFALSLALLFLQGVTAQIDTAHNRKPDKEDDDTSIVFIKIEVLPTFPGGTKGWSEFVKTHLVYPKKAIRKKIEGRVLLQFIVQRDGSLTDLRVVSGDPILTEAALTLMKESPKWSPSIQSGRPVKAFQVWPVDFKLEK